MDTFIYVLWGFFVGSWAAFAVILLVKLIGGLL